MSTGSRSNPTPQARILLVDDNQSGLAARKTVLEELGYRITTATQGEDALEAFKHGRFDLLITDYRMPGMDGVQLIRRIRGLQPGIPVILISRYVEAYGLSESSTGADIVLPKSENEIAHLVRSVSRLLQKKAPKKPPAVHRPLLKDKRKRL